ncbi:DUF2726 domain-containing protein [Vibrio scophthalmi]
MFLLISVVCVGYIASKLTGKEPTKKKSKPLRPTKHRNKLVTQEPPIPEANNSSLEVPEHKCSTYLTTENERRFHEALKASIPDDCSIHCQVSLMALVQPVERKHNSRTWAKRMDFVITDSNTKILAVIELDDKTHSWKSRKKRDDYVNRVLDGHHHFVRFKSARFYDPTMIKEKLMLESEREVSPV